MKIKKKRYISPYIEFVQEDMDNLLAGGGIDVTSQYDTEDSRESKGSHFFDDDDTTYGNIWDTDGSDEWEQ